MSESLITVNHQAIYGVFLMMGSAIVFVSMLLIPLRAVRAGSVGERSICKKFPQPRKRKGSGTVWKGGAARSCQRLVKRSVPQYPESRGVRLRLLGTH